MKYCYHLLKFWWNDKFFLLSHFYPFLSSSSSFHSSVSIHFPLHRKRPSQEHIGLYQWKGIQATYCCYLSLSVFICFGFIGQNQQSQFYLLWIFSTNQDVLDGSSPLLQQVSSESRGSIPESLSEFFDAKEYLLSGSSSENEVREVKWSNHRFAWIMCQYF